SLHDALPISGRGDGLRGPGRRIAVGRDPARRGRRGTAFPRGGRRGAPGRPGGAGSGPRAPRSALTRRKGAGRRSVLAEARGVRDRRVLHVAPRQEEGMITAASLTCARSHVRLDAEPLTGAAAVTLIGTGAILGAAGVLVAGESFAMVGVALGAL